MKQKRRNNLTIVALSLLACLLSIQAPVVALCDDSVNRAGEPYAYDAEGKPDPFHPFIDVNKKEKKEQPVQPVQKGATVEAATEVTQKVGLRFLPPLQRYAIEEFKLVAIGGGSKKRIAIVEDSKGKSFSLYRNSKIGMNEGRVIKILDDEVIIMEKVGDAMGNITPRRVILKLMKDNIEGDK